MSLYDLYKSREILISDPSFEALIMAAFEKARNEDLATLKVAFPEIADEFRKRRPTSLGLLDGDKIQITIESKTGTATYNKVYREGEKVCLK